MRHRLHPHASVESLERRLFLNAFLADDELEQDVHQHDEHIPGVRLEGGGALDGAGPSAAAAAAGPNLTINNARLVDGSNVLITAPMTGAMVFVRAEYTISDVAPGSQYIVRFSLDGVSVDSSTISAPSGTANWTWYRGVGYAAPGVHSVQVTVDGAGAIAETDESDNDFSFNFSAVAPTTLPQKFAVPLRGTQSNDYTFTNYLDVDPRSGVLSDFAGGPFMYDGHTGYDIGPRGFDTMDASVSIHAAAAGTVTGMQDGHFDRQTTQGSHPANYVEITHGNGWRTIYYHFSTNTIVVKVGDTVEQGQMLGLMGSSGSSTGSHLHLGVYHNNAPVETYFDPTGYWQDPLPYQPMTEPGVMDSGTTNYAAPATEYRERISTVDVFPASAGWTVYFWNEMSHLRPTDVTTARWYRPNGVVHASSNYSPSTIVRGPTYWWTLSSSSMAPYPGDWQVSLSVNGVERSRRRFTITSGAGQPEMKLYQGTTYVIDGRTTAIDFGSVVLGSPPPTLEFMIQNHGAANLLVSDITLPPDFSLVSNLPSLVAPGGSEPFTLQLDTDWGGTMFGQVTLTTNDTDESSMAFNVTGTVRRTGAPSTWPYITMLGPAAPYSPGRPPQVLDAAASVYDSNSTHFGGGNVLVEMAGFIHADDRLAIRHEGAGAGQIGVSGNHVLFAGVEIGTFTGGAGATPLLINLNSSCSPAAAQALLQNLTYESLASFPPVVRRYVRVVLTDDTGKVSNMPVKTVSFDTIPLSAIPFAWKSASRLNVRFDNALPVTLSSDGGQEVVSRGGETLTFEGIGEVVAYGTDGDDVLRLDSLARAMTFRNRAGNDTLELLAGAHTFSQDLSPALRNLSVSIALGASADFTATQHLRSLSIDGAARLRAGGDTHLISSSLIIGPSGQLDIADNDLLIDYTGASPYTQIRQYVIDGRSSSAGIVSSIGDSKRVVAPVDNAPFGRTSWNGQQIDATSIIVTYTYYGDSNLDGKVTGDDYVAVDSNLGKTDAQWFHGDFNFDGKVTGDDYVSIDSNLGAGTGVPSVPADAEDAPVVGERDRRPKARKAPTRRVEPAAAKASPMTKRGLATAKKPAVENPFSQWLIA